MGAMRTLCSLLSVGIAGNHDRIEGSPEYLGRSRSSRYLIPSRRDKNATGNSIWPLRGFEVVFLPSR
jgi:hypothetical protein